MATFNVHMLENGLYGVFGISEKILPTRRADIARDLLNVQTDLCRTMQCLSKSNVIFPVGILLRRS